MTCLIGLLGVTVACAVGLVPPGAPVAGGPLVCAACLVLPLLGQNCQMMTIHATTKIAAVARRQVRCRRVGRRRDAGLRYGPGDCCIARSLPAAFRRGEAIGE